MFSKYVSITVLKSNLSLKSKRLLYKLRVSDKGYSKEPEESPCFLVYFQSNHWPQLASNERRHNV